MEKKYYIYILTNHSGSTLYVGITNNLQRRVWEHKQKIVEGFTKKYNLTKLIYFEEYVDPLNAIEREKQLKKWSRKKKEWLISKMNPTFEELKI